MRQEGGCWIGELPSFFGSIVLFREMDARYYNRYVVSVVSVYDAD